MVEKKCDNCIYGINKYSFFAFCEEDELDCYHFIPKEELVRQDERAKIITDLENEIQNFNEVRDRNTIEFIHDFIEELKGE